MSRIQKYPLKNSLSYIPRHDQIPHPSTKLGSCLDTSERVEILFTLAKHEDHLSILMSYHTGSPKKYYCKQYDFPLKVLSWFPWALEEFRKPPIEGGLHAGAMTTKDFNVDGEMLCIQSTTSGYAILNRSRNKHGSQSHYNPVDISMSWEFLYKLGFLDLLKSLGEKYERGEI